MSFPLTPDLTPRPIPTTRSSYEPIVSTSPPTTPGHYRAYMTGRGWQVVHLTEHGDALWAEWLGTESRLDRDRRWAAWDHSPIPMPSQPPTVTLA